MTTKPSKIVYDAGRDQYGRKLEITVEADRIRLYRRAHSQMDDDVYLDLTRDQARAIGEAARGAL